MVYHGGVMDGQGVGWNIKKMMYKSLYWSKLNTGLASFYMRKTDYRSIERETTNKARKIVGEKGVEKKRGG